ncbi:MAG TPA: hypothetical protein VKS99_09060 [Blastocatellia bacterium]|nr:hypothetical protein [Blastocatellia bacterium]
MHASEGVFGARFVHAPLRRQDRRAAPPAATSGLKGDTVITRGSTDFDEGQRVIAHADAAIKIKLTVTNRDRRSKPFGSFIS